MGDEVAVKVFKKKENKVNLENFLKEVEILSGLKHKNIILYMGICLSGSNYMIVTE
jgi:serine/threonine protein kinase